MDNRCDCRNNHDWSSSAGSRQSPDQRETTGAGRARTKVFILTFPSLPFCSAAFPLFFPFCLDWFLTTRACCAVFTPLRYFRSRKLLQGRASTRDTGQKSIARTFFVLRLQTPRPSAPRRVRRNPLILHNATQNRRQGHCRRCEEGGSQPSKGAQIYRRQGRQKNVQCPTYVSMANIPSADESSSLRSLEEWAQTHISNSNR